MGRKREGKGKGGGTYIQFRGPTFPFSIAAAYRKRGLHQHRDAREGKVSTYCIMFICLTRPLSCASFYFAVFVILLYAFVLFVYSELEEEEEEEGGEEEDYDDEEEMEEEVEEEDELM